MQNVQYMQFSWSEFLAGGGITALIHEAILYFRKKGEMKIDLAQNTRDIAQIHRLMEDTLRESMCNRFAVFAGEDSAGVLAAGKNLFITCQYEKADNDIEAEPLIDLIQRWRADSDYYDIFSEMLTKGQIAIKTSDLPDCKLKNIYIVQGIKHATFFHLMTTKDHSKVFFCWIGSTVTDRETERDKFFIDSCISQLRFIFEKHKKFYR